MRKGQMAQRGADARDGGDRDVGASIVVTRIVRTTYRYKRAPRWKKPVDIEVPEVVTVPDRKRRRAAARSEDTGEPTRAPAKPAIVTIRRKSGFGRAEDITVEEANRRADLTNADLRQGGRRPLPPRRVGTANTSFVSGRADAAGQRILVADHV